MAGGKMNNSARDKDMTPLKSHGKMKHRRRFKIDSGVKVSSSDIALASYNYGGEDLNRSVSTPTTEEIAYNPSQSMTTFRHDPSPLYSICHLK
jgi:hypothetical protein